VPSETTGAANDRSIARVGSGLLLAANVLFFWPVLFHGRVFSSHRSALAVAPWNSAAAADDPRARLLADPASGAEPVLRDLAAKLFWNPAAAGGAPGAVNVVQGFLSPFAAVPALLLPEAGIETGILFLKLNAGFLFMFLFLRGHGLRDVAASSGAAAWGWSGVQSAWWLWMQSSVAICFPLLLLAIDGARRGRRFDRATLAAAGAFAVFLAGGYPFMILFGGAAALAYAAAFLPRRSSDARRSSLRLAAAALLAAALLFPAFRLSARTIGASGQVSARAGLAREVRLPLRHLVLYAFPLAAGDPLRDDYRPLTGSRFDTFVETAVGVGPAAIGLALLGGTEPRHRKLYAYAAAIALMAGAIVYAGPVRRVAEDLPLLSAGLLERMKVLVVFGVGIAAAVGAERISERLESGGAARRTAARSLPFVVGLPLIGVAARLYPAVPRAEAVFRETPGIRALERERSAGPSRFLATGWTLYPDLAQPFALEDVRGHLWFEKDYRRLLSAADPGIYGRTGTLLVSAARTLDPASPVLDLLGVSAIAVPAGAPPVAGLPRAYAGGDLDVFRRPSAFPRFFAVRRSLPGGIDEVLRASRETLRTTAFVAAADLPSLRPEAPGNGPAPEVVIESDRPDSFRVRVRGESPTLLASSHKLFPPYWTARVDGRAVSPVPVDGMFFGAKVPAGSHLVEGIFRIPRSEVGVSAAAALALLVLGASSLAAGGKA